MLCCRPGAAVGLDGAAAKEDLAPQLILAGCNASLVAAMARLTRPARARLRGYGICISASSPSELFSRPARCSRSQRLSRIRLPRSGVGSEGMRRVRKGLLSSVPLVGP